MPKVIFKFDKEKDLRNNWDKSNKKNVFSSVSMIDPKIREICENKSFEECKDKLSSYLSKIHNSPMINISVKSVEKAWNLIEKEFFDRMNHLMKHKFTKDINAYLTTLGICPYDPKEPSFMFSFYYGLPKALSSCGHEIMHLYFHEFYWEKVEKEIGKEKTSDLKEALTVLLNFGFVDLWFFMDQGYEIHTNLRKFISLEWKKQKDFDVLIEKCIEYLKAH